MNVAPVSLGVVSTNNQPHFEAKFPKTDMVKLIKTAKMEEHAAGVPKLYTLIEYLYSEIPGQVAKIINKGDSKVIKIDGRPVFKTGVEKSHFQVLKEFLVGEHSLDRIIRIPDRIFENRWFENRAVKENVLKDYAFVPEKPVFKPVVTEEIKPYNITKEAYSVTKSRKKKVEISNIEILSKEKTEKGREELDMISKVLTRASRKQFNLKRKAARAEIEKQKERPEIFKNN